MALIVNMLYIISDHDAICICLYAIKPPAKPKLSELGGLIPAGLCKQPARTVTAQPVPKQLNKYSDIAHTG